MKKLLILLFFITPFITHAQFSYGLDFDDTDYSYLSVVAWPLSGTPQNSNSLGYNIQFVDIGFGLLNIQTIQVPIARRSTPTGSHFGDMHWALWEDGLLLDGGTNIASGTVPLAEIPFDTDWSSTNTPYTTLSIPSTSLGGNEGTFLFFWRDQAPSGQGNGNLGLMVNNSTSVNTSPYHHIGNEPCGAGCNYTSWQSTSTLNSNFNAQGDIPILFSQEALPEIVSDVNIVLPENATNTASTTFDIQIDWTGGDNYTALVYKIYNVLTFKALTEFRVIPIGTATGTYNGGTTLEIGNYEIESYLIDENEIQGTSDTNTFSVIENPLGEIFGFDTTNFDDIQGLATTTCGITNLTGCFQNALVFAFYPSQSALQNFGNLIDEIETKPPFGYFTILTSSIEDLDGSTTPAFILATENNIYTNIFNPIRTGVTWLLWFVFGIWLYKRLTNIKI